MSIKEYTDTSIMMGYEMRRIRNAIEKGGLSNDMLLAAIERIDKNRLKCCVIVNDLYKQNKNITNEIKKPIKSNEISIDPTR